MKQTQHKRALMCSAAVAKAMTAIFLISSTNQALAQQIDESTKDNSGETVNEKAIGLSDIVVTARKRSETLLEVPLAITALPSAEIEKKNITSLQGIADFTPSMSVSSFGASTSNRSQQTVVIRGITPSAGHTATVFINGAPLAGAGLIDGIGDLAQVEIIKGPQSAYFGRSTFAGAVNLITKKPSKEFKATVDLTYGSYNWADIKATVEGPIIKDILTARISGRYYSIQGPYRSYSQEGARFGGQQSADVMGELDFTPADNLEIRAFGAYIREDDGPAALAKFKNSDFNCNPGTARYYCGTVPILPLTRLGFNTSLPASFLTQLKNTPVRYKDLGLDHMGVAVENIIGTVNITYQIPGTGFTLNSVTAGNKVYADSITDLYNEYYPTLANRFPFDTYRFDEAYSQEVRLTSDQSKRLRGTIGYSWTYTHDGETDMGLSPTAGFLSFGASGVSKDTTQGVFASAAFDVTDKLILNLEGRYQKDISTGLRRLATGQEVKVPGLRDERNEFLPRVILQYKFLPQQQVYATFSRGMNPGVFNSGLLNYNAATQAYIASISGGAALSAAPETMDNYEIGYKGSLFGGRLQLDLDGYLAKWKNQVIAQNIYIQNEALTGTSATIVVGIYSNNGRTNLKGLEGNATLLVTNELSISVGGAINDTDIKRYTDAGAATLLGAPLPTPLDLFDGKQLPNYSKYSGNISASYNHDFTTDLSGFVNVDYVYRSGMYDSAGNFAKTPDTNLVNVHIGVQRAKQRIEFFVENLLNNLSYNSITSSIDLAANNQRIIYGGLPMPRRFGVRLHAEF